jgi:hypothetical protein
LCQDELPTRINEWPWNYFGITVSGTWTASVAAGLNGGKIDFAWLATQPIGTEISYTLAYNMSCNINAPGTFIGKIKVITGTPGGADRGLDSAAFCKEAPYTTYTLKDYVTKVANPFPVPSYWRFIGNTETGGGTSASPFSDGTAKGYTTENSDAEEFLFQTGIPYFFRYTLDPTSPYCWASDSGLLRVSFSLATGGTNIDERAEICQKDSTDFDMNAYMSLPNSTVWSPVPAGATVVNGVFKLPQSLGNYVFPYNVPAVAGSCGGASSGKLYVKVTNNIHVADVSIYYCVDIAPASVNLFSLLGIAPVAGAWSVASGTHLTYLATATGELDMANLRINEYPGNTSFTFTFTPDATSVCVTQPVNVTILFGTTMP